MTYTPTTDIVRNDFSTRMAPHMDEARQRAFDRWLTETIRKAKEAGWDEGHEDGAWNTHNALAIERLIKPKITNPYRSQP